jgi:hypothetical protein
MDIINNDIYNDIYNDIIDTNNDIIDTNNDIIDTNNDIYNDLNFQTHLNNFLKNNKYISQDKIDKFIFHDVIYYLVEYLLYLNNNNELFYSKNTTIIENKTIHNIIAYHNVTLVDCIVLGNIISITGSIKIVTSKILMNCNKNTLTLLDKSIIHLDSFKLYGIYVLYIFLIDEYLFQINVEFKNNKIFNYFIIINNFKYFFINKETNKYIYKDFNIRLIKSLFTISTTNNDFITYKHLNIVQFNPINKINDNIQLINIKLTFINYTFKYIFDYKLYIHYENKSYRLIQWKNKHNSGAINFTINNNKITNLSIQTYDYDKKYNEKFHWINNELIKSGNTKINNIIDINLCTNTYTLLRIDKSGFSLFTKSLNGLSGLITNNLYNIYNINDYNIINL